MRPKDDHIVQAARYRRIHSADDKYTEDPDQEKNHGKRDKNQSGDPHCRQPLFIPGLFRGRVNDRYHYIQEKSPHLGIEYVRAGSLAVRQEGRCFLLEPGDAFLLHPGECSEVMTGPAGFCIKDSFQVRGELLNAYLELTGLNRREYVGNFDWRKFEEILDRLGNGKEHTPAENSILTYGVLQLLAYPVPSPSPEPC